MILSPSAASCCSQLIPFSSYSSLLLFLRWQVTALIWLSSSHITLWSGWWVIRWWGSWWSIFFHLAGSWTSLVARQCYIAATIAVIYGFVQHCGWRRVPGALWHGWGIVNRLQAQLILLVDQKLRNILLLVEMVLRNILLDLVIGGNRSVVACQLGEMLIRGGGSGWWHKASLVWRGQGSGLVLQIVKGLKIRKML